MVKVYQMFCTILVPFVQFKKCEKHHWRNVTLTEAATRGVLGEKVFLEIS